MIRSTTTTPAYFTLPAILPAMITGLFILTACGGSVLTNDAPIATDVQNDRCADNPLADGCQAGAGFLSVGLDEDTGDQEAESSEAPPTPITSAYSTQSAPAPQPIGTTETSPKFEPAVSAQQSAPATVTAAGTTAFTDLPSARDATPTNQFLEGGATELDKTGASRADPLRMNLAQATYDGVAIGGDEADGIDFFIASTFSITGASGSTLGTHLGNQIYVDQEVNVDTLYHYAGILSGTDLGAPVDSVVGTATWNGSFRTHNTNPVDFQLTVGFGAVGAKTISAFIKDNARWGAVDNYYLLEGTYTNAGLITGTVNWGQFTGGDKDMPVGGNNGTLTGLIGKEGAVAVFTSSTPASRTIGSSTRPTSVGPVLDKVLNKVFNGVAPVYGYVGGFVASASLPDERVLYNDWFESFDDKSTRGVVETPSLRAEDDEDNSDLFNQFLGISEYANALDETGAGTVTQKGGLTLADDADSGVSFFSNGISLTTLTVGSQSYAGLLAGTDLGAPINDVAQAGEWKGQFKSVGGYYFGGATRADQYIATAVDTTFTLTVTFGAVGGVDGSAGSIEAFVSTSGIDRRFLLAGTYDDKGVITGTVLAGLFNNDDKSNPSATINGTLTGLIGQAGAVGAFISNPDADNYNYAGGFVASPSEDTANLADWTASFAAGGFNAGQDGLFAAGTDVTTIASGTGRFIQWSDTRDFTPGGSLGKFSADTDILLLNDEPNNGIGFRYSGSDTDGRGFAGLLSATDMGVPLDDTSKNTIWIGKIDGIVSEVALVETELRLKVTYGAIFANGVGTIQSIANQTNYTYAASATTVGAVNVRSNFPNTFDFNGGFDANGVITGTIAHTLTANGALNQTGVFSGLIGQDGAVGVFKNDDDATDAPFVGGFVVKPPTE